MRRISQSTQIIAGFVLLLVLIIAVVYITGKTKPLPLPTLENEESVKISMTSAVGIIFPQEMDTPSIESRISTAPAVPIKFNWIGRKLVVSPTSSFPAGVNLTITLKSGASSSDGRQYPEDIQWNVQIREPRIIYLGQATTFPEVWLFDPENTSVHALTKTGGKITGFSPYPDGTAVLFTQKNEQGGADIYVIKSDGKDEHILLNCGADVCRDAVIDTAAARVAFARNRKPGTTQTSSDYYIYILDVKSGDVLPLYEEGVIPGVAPNWSPDGEKIASYDKNSLGIRIRNDNGANDFLLGSMLEQTGSWSPDSNKFIFTDEITDGGSVYSQLYEVDLLNSSILQPIGDKFGLEEYGTPAWSPDGKSIVMGVRQSTGGVTKQLWLFDLAKHTRTAITTESAFSNAAPQWRPDGNALVFQQAQLGSSGIKPAVIVWNKMENTFETIATDGAMPAWLP